MQHEAVAIAIEARRVGKEMPRKAPELLVEAIEHGVTLDAHLLHDLLVEVVEQLLASIALALRDLRLHLQLELVELELNLLRAAALLVDGGDALLELHPRLDHAEHLVAGAKDAVEEAELLVEELVDAQVGGVLLVEEVDHHHVVLLTVAVTAPDALLDALRVPGHVVVDDQVAELQVDALGRGLGGNEDDGLIAEVLDEGGAHVGAGRARDAVGACVLLQPLLVDSLSERAVVGTVEEHDPAGELGLLEYLEQVLLRSARLCEDHRLLLQGGGALAALRHGRRIEAAAQGGQERFALGVLGDRLRQRVELSELLLLPPQLVELLRRVARAVRL